ncbi:MAG: hypothetical protein Q8P39_01315 [Candidatus Yanofskybacteria bacterium]|nr:hypothetical protein [Candidatus Yanofskybacteria bacterium]
MAKLFEFHFNPKANQDRILQTFSFSPKSPAEQQWGSIHVIVELQGALPSSKKFLADLAQFLKKEYYESALISKRKHPAPESSLKAALRKANAFLALEVKNGNVQWVGNLNAAVLVLCSQNGSTSAYFTKTGAMRLWIARGGSFSDVAKQLESSSPDPSKVFGTIGAGKLAEGDRFLVLTKDLHDSLKKQGVWSALAAIEDEKKFRNAFKGQEKNLKGLLFSVFMESQFQEGERRFVHMPLPALSRLPIPQIPTLSVKFPPFPSLPFLRPSVSFPKTALLLGALLLILLGGFFFFQKGNRDLQEARGFETHAQVLIRQAALAFQEGKEEQAGILLQEAWEIVKANAKPENPLESSFLALRAELREQLSEIYGLRVISDPVRLFDFSIEAGAAPSRLLAYGDRLVGYNPAQASFLMLNISTRTVEKVQADRNLSVGTAGEDALLFFAKPNVLLSFQDGVWRERTISLPFTGFEPVAMNMFYDSLYMLSGDGRIFRYPAGSASSLVWIQPSSDPSAVPGAETFAVDGNIWVAKENFLVRFYRGVAREQFAVSVFPAVSTIPVLRTAESLPHLYLLNPEENRLLVLTKFGEVEGQYQSPVFDDLLDAAISSDGKKAYLLNGTSVYMLEL